MVHILDIIVGVSFGFICALSGTLMSFCKEDWRRMVARDIKEPKKKEQLSPWLIKIAKKRIISTLWLLVVGALLISIGLPYIGISVLISVWPLWRFITIITLVEIDVAHGWKPSRRRA
jgi:hypothetical protein